MTEEALPDEPRKLMEEIIRSSMMNHEVEVIDRTLFRKQNVSSLKDGLYNMMERARSVRRSIEGREAN